MTYYGAWRLNQSLHWLHWTFQQPSIQSTMKSCCLYLAISMESKARCLNGLTSTSDLDPSRLPSMVLTAKRDLEASVWEGSCVGANIFNLYCLPLQDVVNEDLQLSGFADDHSVRKASKAGNTNEEISTIYKLESCLLSIKQWMDHTRLKMNPSKTEFIYFGNAVQLPKCTIDSINVAEDLILRSNIIRYLGVWLNSTLNFKLHVTKTCKAAMVNFIRIRGIHHLLTDEATSSLVLSLCVSHLDYCNSVMYGLPDITIGRMQKIQTCVHA